MECMLSIGVPTSMVRTPIFERPGPANYPNELALCNVVPQRGTERLTNGTSTRHIVPDLEFLYASAGLLDQLANKEGTNRIGCISLFGVCLDNYASIERGLVGFLVFAGEVRVNPVSHVCGN